MQALVGAALILWIAPSVLGIEFVIVSHIGPHQTRLRVPFAAAARWRMAVRNRATSFKTFCWRQRVPLAGGA